MLFPLAVPAQTPEQVSLRASDQLTVFGDLYRADAPAMAPAILLFHQGGGDARGEYADIVPRLTREGFHVLATDIRGGGNRFGGTHRASPAPPGFRYCSALEDINVSIDMARAQGLTGPLILWGSSYTATLVVQAGARRSADVRAVLAFSPAFGDPVRECDAEVYVPWLNRARIPLLVVRESAALQLPEVREQRERLARIGVQVFVASHGAHGSSTLVPARVQGDVSPQWTVVLDFLRAARTPPAVDPAVRTITVHSDGWELRGDLVLPSVQPAPLVLMLNKAAGSRAVYVDLAHQLAERDIASLRLDLRGHGESTNRGRSIPSVREAGLVADPHRDIAAALAHIRTLNGVDTARVAIVSASYSGEAVAEAFRTGARARAVVALSPGSFSEASAVAIDSSGVAWLFVRGDQENFVKEWLDQRIRAHSRTSEVWVLPTGSAHASDLLLAGAALSARLADWLRERLQ
jgi:alpha-beta hydrolase superfamily lysophospholipase